jgi:Family of unknown function (DUF6011)
VSKSEIFFRSVMSDGERLFTVGIYADGSLLNPNGYDPQRVRAAVRAAQERKHATRSASAKKAAVTRAKRNDLRVMQAARKIVAGEATGPARTCFFCGRVLSDPESIARGVGSECWRGVLEQVEKIKLEAA